MASSDPSMLVENFFNVIQNPTHTVTAEEEATGKEAFRVGDGRREVADHWAATTANSSTWIKVDCGSAKAANAIFLDRGHNLDGKVATLARSPDNSVWTTVAAMTLPGTAGDGGDFDASNGIKTDEGALAKRFTSETFQYWRLTIAAMGAGLVPNIVGLWLGTTWEPGQFTRPLVDESSDVLGKRFETTLGRVGRTQPVRRRRGTISLKLSNASSEAAAIAAMELLAIHPMWLIHNADETERAVLVDRESTLVGLQKATDWHHRSGVIPWVEREPKIT